MKEGCELLQDLIKISRFAGMREDLVQAGGGNSSCKNFSSNQMLIKASGYSLADVRENAAYSTIDFQKLRELFKKNADDKKILEAVVLSGSRPSIETFLHALTDFPFCLHTHATVVNALTCRKDGEKILKNLFPESSFVTYATPGMDLAQKFFAVVEKNPKAKIFFLQNHGLIVNGETADEIISTTEKIILTIEKFLSCEKEFEAFHEATFLWQKFFQDKLVWVTNQKKSGQPFLFCPDCVVYLGRKIFEITETTSLDDVKNFEKYFGKIVLVSYHEKIFIVADTLSKAREIESVLNFSQKVSQLNEHAETIFLSDKEQDFLWHWDAEKYRQNLTKE